MAGKYKNAKYTGVEISDLHSLREAKRKLRELVFKHPFGGQAFYSGLKSTEWLSQLRKIFDAASRVADLITSGTTTIVQCSDGVDRTTEVVSLAQIMLDPYYRTLRGFGTLIEKEWCSYGFRFRQRDGLGKVENSECSPVFLQFADIIFQMMLQFPCSFEYNEAFLIAVVDELYASRTGTFLSINERERGERLIANRTLSVWTIIDNDKERLGYINPLYRIRQGHNVLAPKTGASHILLWKEFYLRRGRVEVDQIGLGIQNLQVPMNLYQAPLPANEQNRARAISTNRGIAKAVVTQSFDADEEGQISLREGQEVFVLEESNTSFWFISTTLSRTHVGYFPRANLKVLPGKFIPNKQKEQKGSWVSASYNKTQNSQRLPLRPLQPQQQQQQQQKQQPTFLGTRGISPPPPLLLQSESLLGSSPERSGGGNGHMRSKSEQKAEPTPVPARTTWESAKQAKFLWPQRPMHRENTVTVVVKWKVFPKFKQNKKQAHQSTMPKHTTLMSSSSSIAAQPIVSPSAPGAPASPSLKFASAGQGSPVLKRTTSSKSTNRNAVSATTSPRVQRPQQSPQSALTRCETPPSSLPQFNLLVDSET